MGRKSDTGESIFFTGAVFARQGAMGIRSSLTVTTIITITYRG
jgi:hypothetical protein